MKVLVVTNLYPNAQMPAFGTFIKDQVDSVRQKGVEIDVLFINGKKSKLNYLWGFPRLWARLLTKRYDLIHAHYVFSGIIARAQFLYPVILTHTGGQVFHGWQALPCRIVSRLVDRVIVRSREMKDKLGCIQAEIIPAGVDFDLFKPTSQEECRRQLDLPLDKKLVLWAGEYFTPVKRYDIVEKAVVRLQQIVADAQLVLATGKHHDVIPLYMNACDVLLLVSNSEGSPNVIKEAMACNLPIVSAPVGDVSEVIGDTEGCYICSQDPEDVAQKLELALRFGKKTDGRGRIPHMEMGIISRRIISLYEELLHEKKGHGLSRLWFWQKKGSTYYRKQNKKSMYRPSMLLPDEKKHEAMCQDLGVPRK